MYLRMAWISIWKALRNFSVGSECLILGQNIVETVVQYPALRSSYFLKKMYYWYRLQQAINQEYPFFGPIRTFFLSWDFEYIFLHPLWIIRCRKSKIENYLHTGFGSVLHCHHVQTGQTLDIILGFVGCYQLDCTIPSHVTIVDQPLALPSCIQPQREEQPKFSLHTSAF